MIVIISGCERFGPFFLYAHLRWDSLLVIRRRVRTDGRPAIQPENAGSRGPLVIWSIPSLSPTRHQPTIRRRCGSLDMKFMQFLSFSLPSPTCQLFQPLSPPHSSQPSPSLILHSLIFCLIKQNIQTERMQICNPHFISEPIPSGAKPKRREKKIEKNPNIFFLNKIVGFSEWLLSFPSPLVRHDTSHFADKKLGGGEEQDERMN